MSVRVRFAPSPTGELHIGGLRTALFNFLLARKHGGTFILRIEDTDRKRFDQHSADHIQQALRWAGLDWDEGPIFQSQRIEIYQKYSQELVDRGAAYPCFCTTERLEQMRKEQEAQKLPPGYDRRCRALSPRERNQFLAEGLPHTIRMIVPEGTTSFHDIVYGDITVRNQELDDQVLMRSDGYPTYHLGHLVDDHLMQITHVIRGEEWLPSAPKHVILYHAFGWEIPQLCHVPNILAGRGQGKLSKRHGAVSVIAFRQEGYLPQAVINFLALLGWSPGNDQEIFTMKELIQAFSLERVAHTGAIFNRVKLDFINGYYIRQTPLHKLAEADQIKPILLKVQDAFHAHAADEVGTLDVQDSDHAHVVDEVGLQALQTVQERMKTLSEAPDLLSFYIKAPEVSAPLLVPKKSTVEEIRASLAGVISLLSTIEDFTAPVLEKALRQYTVENGLSTAQVLWPIRAALTGKEASPGAFEVLQVLGKDESLRRLEKALTALEPPNILD
jgi:glutamyl-tRNA synthetase